MSPVPLCVCVRVCTCNMCVCVCARARAYVCVYVYTHTHTHTHTHIMTFEKFCLPKPVADFTTEQQALAKQVQGHGSVSVHLRAKLFTG